MGTAWALSLAAAFLFYHFVEKQLSGLRLAPRDASATAVFRLKHAKARVEPAGTGQPWRRRVEKAGPANGRLPSDGEVWPAERDAWAWTNRLGHRGAGRNEDRF
jgi:hypothetical protein